MVEVYSEYGAVVGVKGDVAPDGSPESGAVDGDHGRSGLELVDGEGGVAVVLDGHVLRLEVVHELDVVLVGLEVSDLVAGEVDGEGLLDVLGIPHEHVVVADLLELVHGAESGGHHHLGQGLSLDVGCLHGLEGHSGDSEHGSHNNDYDSRIYYGVNVTVRIHGLCCFKFLGLA